MKIDYTKSPSQLTAAEKDAIIEMTCGKKRASVAKRNARAELVKLHQPEFNTLVKKYENAGKVVAPAGIKAS